MVKSKSRSIYTMAKKGRNILEKVEKYLKKLISVGTVAVATMVLGRNSGVWAVFIGGGLLVSADVTQPIRNIIGIGWIKSADTNNIIIGIS
jgi:hypothetical protein